MAPIPHNKDIASTIPFFESLHAKINAKKSRLCIGVDPHVDDLVLQFERMPSCGQTCPTDRLELARLTLSAFCFDLLEETWERAPCYKPNAAFFEQYGAIGLSVLISFVEKAHEKGCLVLFDFKRGDIGSTSEAYANYAYDVIGADAVTVNAYMGRDGLLPFRRPNKGLFVLCKTSNPGSNDFQTVALTGGSLLYEHLAKTLADPDIGFVVGATDSEALRRVRRVVPDSWILAPGVGAQGASMNEVLAVALMERPDHGLLIPVSRAVARAQDRGAICNQMADESYLTDPT